MAAATDQHYRKQATLDVVFGVSCAAMFGATIWMFVQDFNRDFKSVQRTFRDVEATVAEREMIDKLPPVAEVAAAQKALTEARDNLKAEQKDVEADLKALTAKRELADEKYRGIKADYDAEASYWNIAVDDAGKYPEGSDRNKALLAEADRLKKRLTTFESGLAAAKKVLDDLDAEIKAKVTDKLRPAETAVAKAEDEMKKITGNFDRFGKTAAQKAWSMGDTFRALPILDGFESPTKVKQQWLPDLTIDYGGFRDVPRYDRCMTCHLGIDRGTYSKEQLASLGSEEQSKKLLGKLDGARRVIEGREAAGEKLGYSAADLPAEKKGSYGLILGLLVLSSVIAAVTLGSLEKSFRIGMMTLTIGLGISLLSTGAIAAVTPAVPTVKTIKLSDAQVNQFCVHPKLDLYVDSNSAHPVEKFGCTVCHMGQGSATEFNLATHTPSDARQEDKWKKDYGYHPTHYWDFPMLSKRFTESSCLKCHHQVTDLVRNGVKEEAPKLIKGYNLVKDMGCFGCHEIQGFKGGRDVGPDLRLEPGPALDLLSAAEQEKAKSDPANLPGKLRKVGPSLRRLAEKTDAIWTAKWILDPRGFREDTKMPHFYNLTTNSPENLPDDQKSFPAGEIHAMSHYLIAESKAHLDPAGPKDAYRQSLLVGLAQPKTLAETGLRDLGKTLADGKLDDRGVKELFDVTKRFADLALLSSPMKAKSINDASARLRAVQERIVETNRKAKSPDASEEEKKAVKAEVAGLATEMATLVDALAEDAKPTDTRVSLVDGEGRAAPLPAGDGDAAKGVKLFAEKGCLACHAHEGVAKKKSEGGLSLKSAANFGPELSRIADKISPALEKATAKGWLVQWLLNPNVYHPRTKMPVTHLSPAEANDIAAWLLAQKTNWKGAEPSTPNLNEFKQLARVYLAKAPGVTAADLEAFLPKDGDALPGIPADRLASFARDAEERHLVAGTVTADRLKWYIGKKAIGRLGCYACHDIPGFETAKPIGVGLNDWGKKDHDRLAFEDGDNFAKNHFNMVPTRTTRGEVEGQLSAIWKAAAARIEGDNKDKAEEWLGTSPSVSKVVHVRMSRERPADAEKVLTPESAKLLDAIEAAFTDDEKAKAEKIAERLEAQERIHELEAKVHKGKATSDETKKLLELEPLKLFESVKHDGKTLQPMEEAFYRALEHHNRQGFLHLKLAEPRSYDYNRRVKWDDRLRMPQFKFARTRKLAGESDEVYKARQEKEEAEAREAVMTFVLGLVAEPVPLKYVHTPKADKSAEIVGRQVLEKFNCGGCHQVRPGQYDFKMTPEIVAKLQDLADKAVKEDMPKDHVYLNHTAWFGVPPTSDRLQATGNVTGEGNERSLLLTDALRFYGNDRVMRDIPAGTSLPAPAGGEYAPAYGGTWTELMVPYLQKANPDKYGADNKSRAALPPPLNREGERVQPDWLYKFLLNPQPIRPESYVILRMPKFNMSPEESRALVNYFASVSRTTNPGAGVTAPYVAVDQRDPEFWVKANADFKKSLDDAEKQAKAAIDATKDDAAKKRWQDRLKNIADAKAREAALPKDAKVKDLYSREAYRMLPVKTLCIQCHSIGGVKSEAEQGPNLALAGERLRPEWVEQWVAHPKRMFPYLPVMPQNFENDPDPLKWKYQDLFVGSPLRQTRAVKDVIMNTPRLLDLSAVEVPVKTDAPAEGKK